MRLYTYLAKTSPLSWAMGGFLVVYLLIFIQSTFFNPGLAMQFPEYVPVIKPIGLDLEQILSYSRSLVEGGNPYIGNNLYPPFATIVFTPLLALDYFVAYKLLTLLTVAGFVFITLLFAHMFHRQKTWSLFALLVVVAGLFSYGLQFEIERGQFNVLTIGFAFAGIWLFRSTTNPRWRFVAYALFTIAVQLKVYPALLVVFLIDDWHDRETSVRRLAGLLTVNVLGLLMLGPAATVSFVYAILGQSFNPAVFASNHSLRSYFSQLSGDFTREYFPLEPVILMFIAIVFVLVWRFREKSRANEGALMLVMIVTMLLAPSVSHDYKLSILGGAVVVFVVALFDGDDPARQVPVGEKLMLAILTGAYAFTLFSYALKPYGLQNNLVPLTWMIASGLLLANARQSRPVAPWLVMLAGGWILLRGAGFIMRAWLP
jgi:hypothetical protein